MHSSNEARRDIQILLSNGHLTHLRTQDSTHRFVSVYQVSWSSDDTVDVLRSLTVEEFAVIDRLIGHASDSTVTWEEKGEFFNINRGHLSTC